MQPQPNPDASPKLSSDRESRAPLSERVELFEKRQRELWFLTFLILFLVTAVFAWMSWGWLRSVNLHLEALPFGLVILVSLLGVYVWKKTQEIAELKGLVRGMDHRDAATLPSDHQLQQLFAMISKSQQGFRDLIDSFDDILLALSLEGEIRAVNRSFSDLVARPFQEIIGCHLAEFFEDADGSPLEVGETARARFLERRIWNGVVHVRLKRRNAVYFFDCVAHAMIRDGEVHGVTVLARDITAMKRSEARFTELFESLQEGIYIITPDDKILEVNPALVSMLGYQSKDELLSMRAAEVFGDDLLRNAVAYAAGSAGPQGREITLRRKDGQPLHCLNTATAVRDTNGRIVRFQGALVDITERRSMEKQLHQQQEFARRLIDSFPDLIFVVDPQRRYTFVSPKFKEVLGYEAADIIGHTFGERTHLDDRPAMVALFDDLIAGRQNFASIEVRVRHTQGEWRSLKCNFSPLFNEQGKIEGVVVSGRDVTEVKRLESQLIQAEKLAAMGQMLAGVAHELNNPLTAILGASELLRDRQGVDDNTKRQLEMTHRQARRAARIVQNLLEFSRPASPQKRPLDLNVVIDRTLQLHDHSLRRNNVEVEFHAVPGFPLIVGDANQLIQIFLNLISNAEHAIREVRQSGRVQIRLGRSGNRVFTTVQDDGVGIKPEDLAKIFDPFFTTKRPGGGTGLGLSICMSIVREHGGNIEAASLPAGGAAFTVSLPVAEIEPGKTPIPESDTGSGERVLPTLTAFAKHSILVLDDEESIRMLLSEGLGGYGLKVDCAATAEEALRMVLATKYDAILCDLKLAGSGPNADGYGVAQRLKVAAPNGKPEIIFMSGDLMNGEGSGLPANSKHLQKPFRISDVLHILTELFSPVHTSKH